MKKISATEYIAFYIDYMKGKFPYQRFGQAFVNEFNITNDGDYDISTKLFYCENWKEAEVIIFDNYLE